MFNGTKVIGFDADDTLWVNEPYFRERPSPICFMPIAFKYQCCKHFSPDYHPGLQNRPCLVAFLQEAHSIVIMTKTSLKKLK